MSLACYSANRYIMKQRFCEHRNNVPLKGKFDEGGASASEGEAVKGDESAAMPIEQIPVWMTYPETKYSQKLNLTKCPLS